MSEINLEYEKAVAKAAELGLDIVEPDALTLQLDLDGQDAVVEFETRLTFLQSLEEAVVTYTTSKSGNKHAYVKLGRRVGVSERIALQAALGSDWRRELFSILRLNRGNEHATLLFEIPSEKKALAEKIGEIPVSA